MPKTVPNQRIIEISEKAVCNKENPFTAINLEVLQQVMNDLDGAAFKLWCFYEQNAKGYKVPSGPAYVAKWGIKRTAYYDAFKKLEENGYLVKITEGYYKFYEVPNPECIVEIVKEDKFIF